MKRELQVGDRVAVYNCEGRWFGTVGSVLPADLYEIQPATSATQGWYIAHRKQCRRLIRRKRRRWEGEWHCNYLPDGSVRVLFSPDADAQDGLPKNGERMTLVEARPGKAGRG